MALAMIYPEAKRGRGNKDEARKSVVSTDFSSERLKQARQVLKHSRTFAEQVLAGTMSLDEALAEVRKAQGAVSSVRAEIEGKVNAAKAEADAKVEAVEAEAQARLDAIADEVKVREAKEAAERETR